MGHRDAEFEGERWRLIFDFYATEEESLQAYRRILEILQEDENIGDVMSRRRRKFWN